MSKETIGSRILQRRKALGYNQRELGKASGVSYATISLWEGDRTEPTGKNLHSLAGVLQCSPAWLLFGDEDKYPPPPEKRPLAFTLDETEKELINLFRALPESEQQAQVSELRARVENFNKLFEELLKARKRREK
ncbi:helix-turn-helix domain-containing protein [Rahnella sp. ChDrAdgB13]|uniref:helix-turn-helix domain-containing protein n=1 Tax=Rahnella sp. ChDrAdgB13 TaxID=1850581 RepID=UPI001AD8645C|nr:helix-turn-helix domain-containing protein [Rahnella sp. ChDrAdgB13]